MDSHHKVTVRAAEFEISATPEQIQLPAVREPAAKCDLVIKQRAWDCKNEPYVAPVTCGAGWELDESIVKTGRPRTMGSPADFGLSVELTPDARVPGRAALTVTRGFGTDYVPGDYEIGVSYFVGDSGHEFRGHVTVYLEVL